MTHPQHPDPASVREAQLFMVFDVESIGLHGEGFAVGYIVIDRSGARHEEGVFACPPIEAYGTSEDRQWITENIPVIPPTHTSPGHVRLAFWTKWLEWKARGAVLVADCAWPVEARFLAEAVDDFADEHKWQGPYPLHDLASVMLARGLDPLATNERLADELPVHDPLADARQSARLLIEALSATPAVQPAAQGVETNDYGSTDFGYEIIGPTLEEGDKRLLSLLTRALGNDHPAFDDLEALILRSRSQPPAATQEEPDWNECIRQAEETTGLKVEMHTMSILVREVRRWLAASTPSPAAPTAPATVEDEREAFEKWLLTVSHPTYDERLSASSAIEFARAAWIARAAAVKAAEVPQPILEAARELIIECNPRLTSYPREEIDIDNVKLVARYIVMIAAAPAQGKAVE